jgi:hypothetical protein
VPIGKKTFLGLTIFNHYFVSLLCMCLLSCVVTLHHSFTLFVLLPCVVPLNCSFALLMLLLICHVASVDVGSSHC